jgi:hypothetical protein
LVLAVGRSGSASIDENEFGGLFSMKAQWNREEFEQFLQGAGVETGPDAEVLRTLHVDYLGALEQEAEAAATALRAATEAKRDGVRTGPDVEQPWALAPEAIGVTDVYCAWPIRRAALRERFEEQMVDLVPEPMRPAWDEAARRLRRFRMLPVIASYTRNRQVIDPFLCVKDLTVSPAESQRLAAIQPSLEIACDEKLRAAESVWHVLGRQSAFIALHRPDRTVPLNEEESRRYQAIHDELTARCDDVSQAQRACAAQLLDALDEHRTDLQDCLDRAMFPTLFHESPAHLVLQALMEFDALSPEARRAVGAIDADFQPAIQSLNRRIIAAMKTWEEPEAALRRNQRAAELESQGIDSSGPGGPYLGHPAEPLFKQRLELVRSTCAALRAVVDDGQFDALPPHVRLVLHWPSAQPPQLPARPGPN